MNCLNRIQLISNTMKRIFTILLNTSLLTIFLTSCIINLDPDSSLGVSNDEITRTYAAADLGSFDRLDMGSAFRITVIPGSTPSMTVKGDRRDVEDLVLDTRSNTLNVRYRTSRIRRYTLTIDITMPTLRGVVFSGASKSEVTGFRNLSDLSVDLSGASKSYFDVQASRVTLDLSGASKIEFLGRGTNFISTVSGASELKAFDYPVTDARLDVSGASHAYVTANTGLNVTASGASKVRYRGNPTVQQVVSGASKVERD
jgi:hypothetical protein